VGAVYEQCVFLKYNATSLVHMQQSTEQIAAFFCRVDPEDRGSTFARNTSTYLPNCTASHPGSHQSS